jgi:hypothetical protein
VALRQAGQQEAPGRIGARPAGLEDQRDLGQGAAVEPQDLAGEGRHPGGGGERGQTLPRRVRLPVAPLAGPGAGLVRHAPRRRRPSAARVRQGGGRLGRGGDAGRGGARGRERDRRERERLPGRGPRAVQGHDVGRPGRQRRRRREKGQPAPLDRHDLDHRPPRGAGQRDRVRRDRRHVERTGEAQGQDRVHGDAGGLVGRQGPRELRRARGRRRFGGHGTQHRAARVVPLAVGERRPVGGGPAPEEHAPVGLERRRVAVARGGERHPGGGREAGHGVPEHELPEGRSVGADAPGQEHAPIREDSRGVSHPGREPRGRAGRDLAGRRIDELHEADGLPGIVEAADHGHAAVREHGRRVPGTRDLERRGERGQGPRLRIPHLEGRARSRDVEPAREEPAPVREQRRRLAREARRRLRPLRAAAGRSQHEAQEEPHEHDAAAHGGSPRHGLVTWTLRLPVGVPWGSTSIV